MSPTTLKPKLLIVGSNPSKKSPDGVLDDNSQSGRRLNEWLSVIDPNGDWEIVKINASDDVKFRPGKIKTGNTKSELKRMYWASDFCIALGGVPTQALTTFTADFVTIPHPSGRNRILNDKEFVARLLITLKNMLEEEYYEINK